jgi:hypothetical protein
MLRLIATILTAISLTGCMSHSLQTYGTIDESNKTVTVPAGSEGLKGKLKQVLANDGWRLVVDRGPDVTQGSVGAETRVEQFSTFKSRYRLMVASNHYDYCVSFTPAIAYDVSFVDNETGAEVFTLSGNGCERDVVEKFVSALQGATD